MNAVSPWDQSRWRDAEAAHLPYEAHPHRPLETPSTGPHGSTTAVVAPESAGQALSASSSSSSAASTQAIVFNSATTYPHLWIEKSPAEGRPVGPARGEESYADVSLSYGNAYAYDRHTVLLSSGGGGGGERGDSQQPADHSPPASWRNDRPSSSGHLAAAPLTLHIPQTQEPSGKVRPHPSSGHAAYHSPPSSNDALQPPQPQPQQKQQHEQPQTLSTASRALPSFASLNEHTGRSEDADSLEAAPMSTRISCYLCTKLKPMVKEVAVAVSELDENVQINCNKAMARPADYPGDSPVRTAQWILDRLRYAKLDLQEFRRAPPGAFYSPHLGQASAVPPRGTTSPNLKRPGERWDRDDLNKKPRFGDSGEGQYPTGLTPRDERRSSNEFDSFSGIAYQRSGSPANGSRTARALPSPSSIAYPPSVAPTNVQSVGSPTTPYGSTALHSTTTSSATSAHIADLQHQVTLKSLALQTLQAEYASLLQKLQRERVKSQTIEKKTSVADQEVNELTTRIEDLNDQLKSYETQLEESERKRETERAEVAKEKDQWSRMLEMSGRLHNRGAEERQKLIEEKASLARRLAVYEGEDPERLQQIPVMRAGGPTQLDRGSGEGVGEPFQAAHEATATSSQEVKLLQARVDDLMLALNEAKRHNQELEGKAHDFILQNGRMRTVLDTALQGQPNPSSTVHDGTASSTTNAQRPPPTWSSPLAPALSTNTSSHHQPHTTSNPQIQQQYGVPSSVPVANLARTVSPMPADLGFSVAPTTSSPEELIQALGPIPAPPSSAMGSNSLAWGPTAYPRYPPSSIHHVPRAGYLDAQFRPPGSSPQSYHSSPGAQHAHSPNSSGSDRRLSPDGYASEPEPSRATAATTAAKAVSFSHRTPPFHDYGTHPGAVGYTREGPHMLPPPRPALSRQSSSGADSLLSSYPALRP